MSTDTTFITNEGENNLRDRFKVLLAETRFFDVLVGYFFTSGFYTLLNNCKPIIELDNRNPLARLIDSIRTFVVELIN